MKPHKTYCIGFYDDSYNVEAESANKAKYKLYLKWRDAGYNYSFKLFLKAICSVEEERGTSLT